ncbi:MAG TPA: IS200/IS605 family transposase [Candidatus Angelobacter sp.]|nr:IS200/IS605 family transposase [Candidatus Angelobacter sp.]
MAHTSTHNYLHIVFGTKERNNLISQELQPKLWAYIVGICQNHEIVPFIIGGMPDHIHALVRVPPILPLAKAVSVIKANSSRWMGENGTRFGWQEGYGAFSVSSSNLRVVEEYIRNQEMHHRKMSFVDEYQILVERHEKSVPPLRGL